jgi:nicotinic acid phosphoribosyltransferase
MNLLTSSLLTDLYHVNVIQAYLDHGDTQTAIFEFFVRKLPPQRGILIAAGLAQTLDFLENLSFCSEEIDWLARRQAVSSRRCSASLRISASRATCMRCQKAACSSPTSRSCA